MKGLVLSPNFTIDDIHALREYNYEMTRHMSVSERIAFYNEGGKAFQREIEQTRQQGKV